MNITSAQHQKFIDEDTGVLKVTIDGIEMQIPKDPDNRHYAEIMKQVKAGTLTIKDAD